MFAIIPLLFLLGRLKLGFCLPTTSEGALYIAPTKLVSPWRYLTPEAVDCRGSVGRRGLELTSDHRAFSTQRWSPHMTISPSGYSCYGLRKVTRCSRSFFGYGAIEKTAERYLPSPTQCREQYQKFRENHYIGVEYPFPSCHWMGDDIVEASGLIIVLNPVEYDPFSGLFRDHLLAEGRCQLAPCITNDKLAYWFNSTSPEEKCRNEPEIDVYENEPLNKTDLARVEFISLSLQARTFRGSCVASYCNSSGILLHTREWIEASRGLVNRFPKWKNLPQCYNKTVKNAYETQPAIVTQVLHEYQYDELFKECKKVQETLILNETISRTDLQYLIPTSIGRGPVYRVVNQTIQVASGVYETIVFPDDNSGTLRGYTLGLTLNHSDPILWNDPIRISLDLVDGPNGMFWYRGRLVHPGRWEGRIREVTEHLTLSLTKIYRDPGILYHDMGIQADPKSKKEFSSPDILRHVAHLTVLESVGLLIGVVILGWVTIRCLFLRPTSQGRRIPAITW